jgi:hypothetical protein
MQQNKFMIGGLTPQCAKDHHDENFGTAIAGMAAVKEEAASNTLSLSHINLVKNTESQSAS